MNNNNEIVGSTKGTSTLTRARFGPGMLLQHGDLEQLNNYTRDLSRLLFRSFFGCGVVCGLTVEGSEDDCKNLKVAVQPGLALACSGDPVYVPEIATVETGPKFDVSKATAVWVVLCSSTKCCSPRPTTCSSDEDEATSECTREKDAFEIRLYDGVDAPKCLCACGKPATSTDQGGNDRADRRAGFDTNTCKCIPNPDNNPCYQAHYAGTCGCTCGDCSACDCNCILLGRLVRPIDPKKPWIPDHAMRRFIRPVLMLDPRIEADRRAAEGVEPAEAKAKAEAYGVYMAREIEGLHAQQAKIQTKLQRAVQDKKKLSDQVQALTKRNKELEQSLSKEKPKP